MSERTPLLLVLLVVALVGGGALLREPLFRPYAQMAVDLQSAREEADRLRAELQRRRSSTGEAAELQAVYGPPLDEAGRMALATSFYRRIEALALGSNLKVQSIQPRPEILSDEGIVKIPVQVAFEGDTQGLVAFLAQLASTTALVGAERLVVRRRDNAEHPLTVQVRLVAYGVADQATREHLKQAKKAKQKPEEGRS